MAKDDGSSDSKKLDEEIDKKALHDKVSEYMGPTPEDAKKNGIEVKTEEDELLPSDKLPILTSQKPKVDAEPHAKDDLDDPATDKAVDEIVAKESDEVLEAEDEKKMVEADGGKNKPSAGQRIKQFLKDWWGDPVKRKVTLVSAAVIILVVTAFPASRYFVLNTVGIRASSSVTVLDESTTQPLKNVNVSIGKVSGQTDSEGKVRLTGLKLGKSTLSIEKRAFAKQERKITIGWGSNPQGDVRLTPTGSQYTFKVTDFLSGRAVENAEAASGEANAAADSEGKIVLTVDSPEDELKVTISAQEYRSEEVTINADTKGEQAVSLAPSRKHVFVSKRSGKYDLYKIDADGKNEELLLAGTGNERDDMTIAVNHKDEVAAFVSTRDGQRNGDGYLLSQLYLIDLSSGEKNLVTSSEQVKIVDWIGKRVVYVKIAEGTSASNPKRHRLLSYDYESEDFDELASTNYFNDVLSAGGVIYYAPSSAYQPAGSYGLFKVDADGSNRQTLLGQEAWNVLRADYDTLNISSSGGDWYEYKFGGGTPSKISGAPTSMRSKLFINNLANSQSLWLDERDGKGVLVSYDVGAKSDKVVVSQSGLNTPIRWLSNRHIVFRVSSGNETADYVVNLDGGDPKKIKDVTNTGGLDRWYYY